MQFVQEEGASERRRLRNRPRLGLRIKEQENDIYMCVVKSVTFTDGPIGYETL